MKRKEKKNVFCFQYTPTERDFGLSFECRALNPRVARHAFTLQRAQPPKKVNITDVKPSATTVEILVQTSDHDDLPLIQYVLKYDVEENSDNPLQQTIIPGNKFDGKSNGTFVFF